MNQNRNRKEARRYALQLLFAGEFHGREDNGEVLDEILQEEVSKQMDQAYAATLIKEVTRRQPELDALIQQFSPKRKIERMDRVDRSILRLAAWEMKFADPVLDPSIVINEAVNLAREYGSDSSYKLINALLDQISKQPLTTENQAAQPAEESES